MQPLSIANDPTSPFKILCLGSRADDIEIGCGGTILVWLSSARTACSIGRVQCLWNSRR